jgi:Domain of unknown function (DUF4345)
MNGRVVTAFIGVLTVAFGVIGLTYPLHVMDWVGFSPLMTKPNAAPVEARAIYGGLFLVLGIFTLWAATSPRAHRAELLLIACLWLGLFGGRMVGVSIEGSPGLLNTLGAVFEVVVGCLLLAAPYLSGAGDAEPAPAPPAPLT